MDVVRSPGVDIGQLVENARRAVSGKTPMEALKAFCNLHRGVNAKKERETAPERLREHPLQALFPATVMSRDWPRHRETTWIERKQYTLRGRRDRHSCSDDSGLRDPGQDRGAW